MQNEPHTTSYYLVETGAFEKLLRTNFKLTQSTLLFEHLCSQSDRPMFLSAGKVCDVLTLTREQLEQSRLKRLIKARAFQNQMMYEAYDLITLSELFYRRKLQRMLSKLPKFAIHGSE